MIRTKIILSILLLSTTLASCDSGDDLAEIFQSHTWKLSFFYDGGLRISPASNAAYTLKFYDTTFAFTTTRGATITGYWQADNKERTFSCSQVKVSNGSIDGDTIATKAIKYLKEARKYEGDSNFLKIMIQKNSFMQFHNK
ncbi:MAG: DUF4847 family protein [Bacteroidaceae bacterium]|jgi:hypothetical protein|nr:DUF4847 family protein [Bacteroidaceae bacterium]